MNTELKDVGVKSETPDSMLGAPDSTDDQPKEVYPSLRFSGKEAAIIDLKECKYGDEYEMTIRVRCTSIGGLSYPGGSEEDKPAVEFDVLAASEPSEIKGKSEPEKKDKYEQPKKKAKQRVVGPKEMGMDE